MTPVVFVLAIHTKNTLNANFGNSRAAALAQASKDRSHREIARMSTIAAMRSAGVHPADLIPSIVTLGRYSAGRLDEHDGLPAALKRVVDGIALALGVDDGGGLVKWQYQQVPCARGVHGVRVQIERRVRDSWEE